MGNVAEIVFRKFSDIIHQSDGHTADISFFDWGDWGIWAIGLLFHIVGFIGSLTRIIHLATN